MNNTTSKTEYITKLLVAVKNNANLFKEPDINFILGLTATQVKDIKKYAITENLIRNNKKEFLVTLMGDKYLQDNFVVPWADVKNPKRPEINLEYLKEEKAPPTLTKAIRQLARHLLGGEILKENSTEHYLVKELLCTDSSCADIKNEIENIILQDNRFKLSALFEKFSTLPYGLAKSIISVLLLDVLAKNKDILAIYEQGQFQLELNQLIFDRMIYVPQNFELQKTVLDIPVLEEILKIILPEKSKNILEITKGLVYFIRNCEKYTLSTERLSKPALRFRNAILNAKDPAALFERDIPKILSDKPLCECDTAFVRVFDEAMKELRVCYPHLLNEIREFLFDNFKTASRENLTERFNNASEFLSSDDLKILHNNVENIAASEDRWLERIATFINKSRVPKDWSDNDVADFKVKVKTLS